MNTGRVVDILSFNVHKDFPIVGSDVVIKAGTNVITREEGTYHIASKGNVYGAFSIDLGHLLFEHLSGSSNNYEVSDGK